ncbi:MOSC domain-containing protein [Rubellicoccus peritrichatus]|uniref:MOSC domain-containing protein n=1 Tax=Rubellicoccus peritrichatus TaxID=3080537 RepID=A0AAQ3LBT5_9BACT|nr:MOSC domain-containing protein [Puniceicoccus sp. CR14]WOO41497.1 MOSC domain-containing protein [Puniceicoccus sp. CR14]
MGTITEILISKSPDEPMCSLRQVNAIAGRGLEGDRYFTKKGTFTPEPHKPDFELTLIEKEKIDEFVEETGLDFEAKDARRNLVTVGVDLNRLVDKAFQIGEVKVKGIRLCEPCNYLAKQTYRETLKGLVHKGGLRAQILSDGAIKVGDAITEYEQDQPG